MLDKLTTLLGVAASVFYLVNSWIFPDQHLILRHVAGVTAPLYLILLAYSVYLRKSKNK